MSEQEYYCDDCGFSTCRCEPKKCEDCGSPLAPGNGFCACGNCGRDPISGICSMAGTEFCDWECPFSN